jgi:hypothetical protein
VPHRQGPCVLASGIPPGQSEPLGNPRLTLVSDGNLWRRLRSRRNIGVDGRVQFWMDLPVTSEGNPRCNPKLLAVCQTIITLRRVKLLRPMQFGVNPFAIWALVKIARMLASEAGCRGFDPGLPLHFPPLTDSRNLRCVQSKLVQVLNPPNTLNLTAPGCIPPPGSARHGDRLILHSDKSVTKITEHQSPRAGQRK